MRLDEHKSELLALALFTHRNGAKLQHPPPPRVGSEHGTGGLLGCVDVGQQAAKAALARARAHASTGEDTSMGERERRSGEGSDERASLRT